MLKLRLQYWRQRRAMTVDELVEKAHVSSTTIANIELRDKFPKPDVIRRLAEALNVSVDQLVIDEEEEEKRHQLASDWVKSLKVG